MSDSRGVGPDGGSARSRFFRPSTSPRCRPLVPQRVSNPGVVRHAVDTGLKACHPIQCLAKSLSFPWPLAIRLLVCVCVTGCGVSESPRGDAAPNSTGVLERRAEKGPVTLSVKIWPAEPRLPDLVEMDVVDLSRARCRA